MKVAAILALAALIGCSSGEFDLVEASDAEPETAATDTGATADTSTETTVVDDASVPEVIAADTCVPNACGSCGVLENPPSKVCGECMSSSYVCDGPVTKCLLPDDRSDGVVDYFTMADGKGIGISGPASAAAIAFKMQRDGMPTTLRLAMQRYDVADGAVGDLQVRLIRGTPTAMVDPSNVLATSLIAATVIPDTPSIVLVVVSGAPKLTKGTELWVEVTDRSEACNFAVNGATASGPADLDFYYLNGGSYLRDATIDPYLRVGMKACF